MTYQYFGQPKLANLCFVLIERQVIYTWHKWKTTDLSQYHRRRIVIAVELQNDSPLRISSQSLGSNYPKLFPSDQAPASFCLQKSKKVKIEHSMFYEPFAPKPPWDHFLRKSRHRANFCSSGWVEALSPRNPRCPDWTYFSLFTTSEMKSPTLCHGFLYTHGLNHPPTPSVKNPG